MNDVQITGRSSSHFTRVVLMFAHELGIRFEFQPVYDMKEVDPAIYAGNPTLKLPTLRRAGSLVFGAENICRALADMVEPRQIVWPEQLRGDVACNAQELVWHSMAAQVQLIFGTAIAKLPAENIYFTKASSGFAGALGWLDANLAQVLSLLPAARVLSLFEVTLFCLMEHIAFRPTVPLAPYSALLEFTRQFGGRDAAKRTTYRVDEPPGA